MQTEPCLPTGVPCRTQAVFATWGAYPNPDPRQCNSAGTLGLAVKSEQPTDIGLGRWRRCRCSCRGVGRLQVPARQTFCISRSRQHRRRAECECGSAAASAVASKEAIARRGVRADRQGRSRQHRWGRRCRHKHRHYARSGCRHYGGIETRAEAHLKGFN